MKKTLLILLSCTYLSAFCQVSDIIPASHSIANTSVARTNDWSAFNNPASLIQTKKIQASILFENKYLIPELSTKLAQVGHCNRVVNIGLSFSHFGYSKYNEMLVGVTLARNFGDKFSLGIQGNYYTSYFSDEAGYRGTFIPQVGITAHLSKNFTLGFHSFNPFQQNLKTDYIEKRISSIFSIGTNYEFSSSFKWLTQIDKEVSSNFRFATGFEWDMAEQFTLKLGGYGSEYFVGCFGVGLHLSGFSFHLNCELHPLLGLNTLGKLSWEI